MPKAIKSFTVDENVYNGLVSMFKKYDAGISISLLLNNYLKDIFEGLVETENGLKNSRYTVPMKYVVDEMAKSHLLKASNKEIEQYLDCMLDEYQENYEADQKGIPREYYKYVKIGKFKLSANKKYITDIETGKKYIAMEGSLKEIIDEDSKKRKNRGEHGK